MPQDHQSPWRAQNTVGKSDMTMMSREHIIFPSNARGLASAAFTRWYLGLPARRIELAEEAATGLLSGPPIESLPLLETAFSPRLWEAHRRHRFGNIRGEQLLLVLAAGLSAGEADAPSSIPPLLEDWIKRDHARTVVAEWLTVSTGDAWATASERARLLTNSPRGRRAVSEMASLLAVKGWLDIEIDDICCLNFCASRPRHDVWATCWPPTDAELGEAAIPSRVLAWMRDGTARPSV